MSNSLPCKPDKYTVEEPDYSLPCRLTHKYLDKTPLVVNMKKANDGNYEPDSETSGSSSYSSSLTSYSNSNYDPLEDLSGYLKMRDKL